MCVVFLLTTIASAQSVEQLMNQGNALLQNGAYDQAVTKFRKVLGRDPGNFEAQFNLAFSYLNWGRTSKAVTEFRKALAINRRCTECWGNLALAYEAQGNDEKALGALHEAVKANPGNIEARINLATMYANKDRIGNAITQYKQIIKMDGRNIDAHVNLAKCLVSKGKTAEAKGYLKSAMAIDPNDAEAIWEMANIVWKKDKKRREALKLYRKAVTLQPNSKVYYENLALLLEEMDEKMDAIEVWKKSLIYLDDALKKERIENRIAMLERGEAPSGVETPEKLFGQKDRSDDIAKLKNEVRTEQEGGEVKMISTDDPSVESDLDALDQETGDEMEFDMKRAVKKKMKERKGEE
jgi:tetratricopeptide (TPR) repeat protein